MPLAYIGKINDEIRKYIVDLENQYSQNIKLKRDIWNNYNENREKVIYDEKEPEIEQMDQDLSKKRSRSEEEIHEISKKIDHEIPEDNLENYPNLVNKEDSSILKENCS